jgi:hypothetical protein
MTRPGPPFRARLVFLGASNVARDFPTVVTTARELLAPAVGAGPVQIFSAVGHGRSYGTWSRVFLVRDLPGITRCGLWTDLEEQVQEEQVQRDGSANRDADPPLYALLTDIGNDLAYGVDAGTLAGWVETCLERLAALGACTVMTLLPLDRLRRLPPWQLQLLRLVFFPTHRISYDRTRRSLEELQDRLRDLAGRFRVPVLEPDADWFGVDPLHFRRGRRRRAWRAVLGQWRPESPSHPELPRAPRLSRLGWWALTPERWRLAGVPLGRAQPAGVLDDGTEVWRY